MSPAFPWRVVFDCPVFAQALINPLGPAAACLTYAQSAHLTLFISDYVLREVRELPLKLNPKFGLGPADVGRLIRDLAKYALPVDDVPAIFTVTRLTRTTPIM